MSLTSAVLMDTAIELRAQAAAFDEVATELAGALAVVDAQLAVVASSWGGPLPDSTTATATEWAGLQRATPELVQLASGGLRAWADFAETLSWELWVQEMRLTELALVADPTAEDTEMVGAALGAIARTREEWLNGCRVRSMTFDNVAASLRTRRDASGAPADVPTGPDYYRQVALLSVWLDIPIGEIDPTGEFERIAWSLLAEIEANPWIFSILDAWSSGSIYGVDNSLEDIDFGDMTTESVILLLQEYSDWHDLGWTSAEIEARAAQVMFAAAILGATAPTLPNVLAGTRWADPAVGHRLRAMYDSIAEDTSFASSMAIQVGPGVYRLPPNPTPEQVVFVIQEWANGLPMISPVDLVKLLVTSVIPDPGAVAAGGPGAVIEIISLIPAGRLADVAKAFERAADAADAADDVSDAARAVANAAEEMAEHTDEVADAASAAEEVDDVTDAVDVADEAHDPALDVDEIEAADAGAGEGIPPAPDANSSAGAGPVFDLEDPLAHLDSDLVALSEQHVNGSGTTVIGPYAPSGGGRSYIEVAEAENASYFDIGSAWDAASPAERLAANQHFLDVAISNGDTVVVSVSRGRILPDSYTAAEVEYLQAHGYEWVDSRTLAPAEG